MTNPRRYAVLFKVVGMDAFSRRQLARAVRAAPSGDVFVMADETRRDAGVIDHPNVLRYREGDALSLGFPEGGEGALYWYNADYPLYWFQHLYPHYDYIVMLEYDAVPDVDLDAVIAICEAGQIDFVGEPIDKPLDVYWWTASLLGFYPQAVIRPHLICAAVFSARAVRHLGRRRLYQAGFRQPEPGHWPIGESFVGTELAAGGFAMRPLSAFGGVARYDWWPPVHESELVDCRDQAFIHPVLAGRAYWRSLFKNGKWPGILAAAQFAAVVIKRQLRRAASPAPLRDHRLPAER